MKRLIYTFLLVALLPFAEADAQKKVGHNAAVSRNLEILNDIYKQLDIFYVDTLDADTVIGWGIRSLLRQVDPFTDYYPQADEELRQMTTGKYAGIGSGIRYHKKEARAVISDPFENSPSQRAGLKAGDVIMRIDGKDVKGLGTPKVSNMLRGEAGTTFELVVRRGNEEKTIHITRQTIQVPQIPYYGMLEDGIGYIFLADFTEGAFKKVQQAYTELRQQGIGKLVLDLRGNPGGSVNEAVDIVNLFVPKGRKVVYTRGKMKHTEHEYNTAYEPVDTVMPIVVLVDGGSASASEIVAGSLQDMDRAVVMGIRTYGKGLVQMVRDVSYGGHLKITTGRYYIPSGRCIQAYDYRHLNADGSAGTVPDSLTRVFHTAGGREVRDGGGIKPDVEVRPDSLPTLIYDLVASDEFFDWATDYCGRHGQIAPAGEIRLTDEEYSQFVQYITESGFTYNRRTEEVLKLLRDVARREGYLEQSEQEFEALKAKLSPNLATDLMRFRKHIEEYIVDELAHRYYYQWGAARQQLTDDPCIGRVKALFSDMNEYNKILGK
ncbi:MAG: S41 family peptidase [Bacteroidaceae bacterium]|nr:S41 family peptidase [Bacteroidaceae bacterium]